MKAGVMPAFFNPVLLPHTTRHAVESLGDKHILRIRVK